MKPNFALSLSFDGLRLMHRVSGGWHLVGQVALDDVDLTGALDRLRAAAESLEPNGISTKVLIPNAQIKYLALDTTSSEDSDVRQALQGATPYAVDDLIYDYTKGGGRTYVAAVAKETLDEAKEFAAEHGFNPVSFAAVPEPFTYVGEAFFGGVDGKSVERDEDSVIIIGEAAVHVAKPDTAVEPAIETEVSAIPVADITPEVQPDMHPVPADEPDAQPDLEDAFVPDVPDVDEPVVTETNMAPTPDEVAPVPDAAEPEAAEPELAELSLDEPAPEPVPEPEPVIETIAEDLPEPDLTLDLVKADPANNLPVRTAPIQTVPNTPDTDIPDNSMPMFASHLFADRNEGRPAPAPKTDTRSSVRTEPTFARQTSASLSTPSLSVPTGKGTDPMPSISAPSRTADTHPVNAPIAQPVMTKAPDRDVSPTITGDARTALSPDAAISAASLSAHRSDDDDQSAGHNTPDETPSAAASTVGGALGGMFASRRMALADAKTNAAQTNTAPDTANEKSRLTVFGARKQPKTKLKVAVGGKPRFLGLILTSVLLLFMLAMAAVAALSEDGFASWFGFGSSETQIATDPTAAPTSAQTPTSVSEVAAPQTAEVPQQAPAANATDAGATNLTQGLTSGGQVLTPEEATRIYAATGVWQRAARIPQTPRTTTLENMTLTVLTRPVVRVPSSPLASASSVAGDSLIAAPIDPPPPSQTFDYNAEGMVVATPQGAVTPDGILIIAGRPPLNPPVRPGTIAPEVTPQDQLAAVIPQDATQLEDAPEGVIVIAGRPTIEPPIRTGTAAPTVAPETVALASGVTPLLATDGLLVLAGSPPVLPPVRPGTIAPSTIIAPQIAPQSPPDVDAIAPVNPEIAPLETPSPITASEGVNLIAGSPSILPPARPGTNPPPATVETLTQDIAAALTTNTAQTPTAETRRPLPRPAAVVQAAVTAAEIAATQAAAANTPILGALTVTQAAAFRPRTRPAGLAPDQTPAQTPDPEILPEDAVVRPTPAVPTGLQISPEIAAAVLAANNRPNPIVNPTALAVPVSSRPDPRPRNMARIVARANDARERAAAQVAAAAVAPRTVTPSGPTGTSVARAATLDNAINLRDVNLIGIYGGSGDRRALVRMSNGRYVRVTVGDRLDGGRVTAISAEALNYTKRGSAITLRVAG